MYIPLVLLDFRSRVIHLLTEPIEHITPGSTNWTHSALNVSTYVYFKFTSNLIYHLDESCVKSLERKNKRMELSCGCHQECRYVHLLLVLLSPLLFDLLRGYDANQSNVRVPSVDMEI